MKLIGAVCVTAFAILAALWIPHQAAEQGIFNAYHLPLGVGLLAGQGYPATYPLWGYPAVVGVFHALFPAHYLITLPAFQIAVLLASILFVCWPVLDKPRLWLLSPLFFPAFLHASVRWADALYVLALLWLLVAVSRRSWWLAGLAGFAAFSLRPDFLPLALFLLAASIFVKGLRRPMLAAVVGALLALAPWYAHTGQVSSTNGGLVAFVSLGQLPDNPWHRLHDDREGFALTAAPVSAEGNALLMDAALSDIRCYPAAFAHKMLHNFASAMIGGVFGLPFPAVFAGVLALFFLSYRRDAPDHQFVLLSVCFALAWVSLLQYQPRHMSGVYLLSLIEVAISYVPKNAIENSEIVALPLAPEI